MPFCPLAEKVKRSKGQKVKRSKGQKAKRSKGQKVKRSKVTFGIFLFLVEAWKRDSLLGLL